MYNAIVWVNRALGTIVSCVTCPVLVLELDS